MRFVWFWTFWHWSRESFREGSLLRGPLQGIGSHWDEWYLHEASEKDRVAIKDAGRTESTQRQFIAWLFLHWTRGVNRSANRLTPRFVLGQLARVPPFNEWSAFKDYRTGYGFPPSYLPKAAWANRRTFGRSRPSFYQTIQAASRQRSCQRGFKLMVLNWTSPAESQ
jgi:hypothetical protein